jgi:hypothetical protein
LIEESINGLTKGLNDAMLKAVNFAARSFIQLFSFKTLSQKRSTISQNRVTVNYAEPA